jgi:hypothetical protein
VGGSCLPVGRYEGAFIALSASSGKFGRPQSLNRGLDDVPGKLYYILAGSEDRATQACDPSAEPVAIQRDGLGPVPGSFPSRWQPLSDKRKLDTSAGLRITHTKQRGANNSGPRPSLFGWDHRWSYTKHPDWAWRHAGRNLPTNFPEEPEKETAGLAQRTLRTLRRQEKKKQLSERDYL